MNIGFDWLMRVSFIIFISVSLMVWREFKPFILLEEKTADFIERVFGHPEMTYSEDFFTGFLTFLVTYGSAPYLSVATVLMALFLFLQGEFLIAITFLAIVSTGGIFGIVLKNIFKRPRPKHSLAFEKGYSFPSGHAIATSLFFLTILLLLVPMIDLNSLRLFLTVFLSFLWFIIIFSRLYFHAHHLGDVIVGVFYAVFWVRSGIFIIPALMNLLINYF